MGASVQVMVLVTVAAVATVYAFVLEIRRATEHDRFVDWLKTDRSDHWEALTRSDRFFTFRAVEILRRGSLADDADFHDRYPQTKHGRRFAVAMILAALVIAILLIGTTNLGWDW